MQIRGQLPQAPPVALVGGVHQKIRVEWGEVLSLPTRGARIKSRLHNPNGLAVIPHPGVKVRGVGEVARLL